MNSIQGHGVRLVLKAATVVLACALALTPWAAFADDASDVTAPAETVSQVTRLLDAQSDFVPARSIHDANESAKGLLGTQADDELPSAYSSVDAGLVTPVRDQGSFGTCWAFATIGALESSLLAHGQVAGANGTLDNGAGDASGSLDDGSDNAGDGSPLAEDDAAAKDEGEIDRDNPAAASEGGEAASSSLDLSERHLAYFAYHAVTDPLGYTQGDATRVGAGAEDGMIPLSDKYLTAGGNPSVALYTMASWRGAVAEETAPYDALSEPYWRCDWDESYSPDQFLADTALDAGLAYAAEDWRVSGFRQISLSDAEDVKRAVRDYGGCAVLMSWDDAYYNSDAGAYYHYGSYDTNHVVLIVGWDDDYARENFVYDDSWADEYGIDLGKKTAAPNRDGAWLIKNSWGTWQGNEGYFWLSYADMFARGEYSKAYVCEAQSASKYDNIYQHDGSAGSNWNYVNSGGSIANVYTAKANPEGAEELDAVSFALDDVNVDYDVQVYLNVREADDPTSGSPAFAEPVHGKTDYAGYYTIPLPRAVPLPEGCVYSVVVTLSHENGARVAYSVDMNGSQGRWAVFQSTVHPGESFRRARAGEDWRDLSTSERFYTASSDHPRCCARIKAFTRNVAVDELDTLPFDEAQVSLEEGAVGLAYTGSSIEPGVRVTYGDAPLVPNVDYRVTYANNMFAGEASALVEPIGVYAGEMRVLPFAIAKAPCSISVASPAARTFGAKAFALGARLVNDSATRGMADANASAAGASGAASVAGVDGIAILGGFDDAVTLKYASSNPKVAAVSGSGRVTVKGAGTTSIAVSFEGDANHEAAQPVTVNLKVAKAKNTLSVKPKTVSFKASKLTRAAHTANRSKAFKVTGAKGAVTYKKASGNAKIKVSKTGKLTAKRGLARGTYKVKVRIRAAGTANYKPITKTVTIRVKVK